MMGPTSEKGQKNLTSFLFVILAQIDKTEEDLTLVLNFLQIRLKVHVVLLFEQQKVIQI